jgi:hypothetical protein
MKPKAVVERARDVGLDMIAICDHNSAENLPAFIEAGKKEGLAVLPGMEVTSREEIHLLTIFNSPEDCFTLQSWIYQHLPGKNDEDVFGPQILVNEESEVIGHMDRMLIGASLLSIEQIVSYAGNMQGLAIASHVDRQAFSLLGQLGFIPEGVALDALEISRRTSLEEARNRFGLYQDYAFVRFSDAHSLEEIGKASTGFFLEERTSGEIRMALHSQGGRRIAES